MNIDPLVAEAEHLIAARPCRARDAAAEIEAFIAATGVTRCPTAAVARTAAAISNTDRAALAEHAAMLPEPEYAPRPVPSDRRMSR